MTQVTSVADSSEWSPPEGQPRATTVLPPTRTFVEATGRQLPSQHQQRRLAIVERGKTPLRVQQKIPAVTTTLLPRLNKERVHLPTCGVASASRLAPKETKPSPSGMAHVSDTSRNR